MTVAPRSHPDLRSLPDSHRQMRVSASVRKRLVLETASVDCDAAMMGGMDAGHPLGDRVRASVATTRAEGTAAVRFAPSRIDVQPSLAERLSERSVGLGAALGRFEALGRQVRSALRLSELQGPLGQIDFVHRRCLYATGEDGWKLTAPGVEYSGEPGAWERIPATDDVIPAIDPLWLLSVLDGVTDAADLGDEAVLGEPCRRYRASVSFSAVADQSQCRLARPSPTRDGADQLSVEAWLDRAGRIRRATCQHDPTLMMLELSEFGSPARIELPTADEIVWTAGDDPEDEPARH